MASVEIDKTTGISALLAEELQSVAKKGQRAEADLELLGAEAEAKRERVKLLDRILRPADLLPSQAPSTAAGPVSKEMLDAVLDIAKQQQGEFIANDVIRASTASQASVRKALATLINEGKVKMTGKRPIEGSASNFPTAHYIIEGQASDGSAPVDETLAEIQAALKPALALREEWAGELAAIDEKLNEARNTVRAVSQILRTGGMLPKPKSKRRPPKKTQSSAIGQKTLDRVWTAIEGFSGEAFSAREASEAAGLSNPHRAKQAIDFFHAQGALILVGARLPKGNTLGKKAAHYQQHPEVKAQ